jgi:Ca2+-transporting ATPase
VIGDLARLRGLGEDEAARRLAAEGPNELPAERDRHVLGLALDVVREPMLVLLLACAVLYLALGDVGEASVLLASLAVVILITVTQERRAERALATLRDLSSPRALVIRDGSERRIAGREVVRGDLVVISEGDRVPADGIVIWALNLSVDESLLTGESLPVPKVREDDPEPGGDPRVYAGTLVVGGQGIARMTATGAASELGRIGRSLAVVPEADTGLRREVRRLVRGLAVAGLGLCVSVAVLHGLARRGWLDGILAGLALAMAMIPEEVPAILTLFLAIGAWRLSRRHVLVRRMPALEALGATTVLCVDKTGTLTENRMAVAVLEVDGVRWEAGVGDEAGLPEPFHRLVEFAVLASQRGPFDPMERAIERFAVSRLRGTEHLHESWELVREYPLSRELLAMSHVWRDPCGPGWVVAAKGAPEAIADLCHLGPSEAARLAARAAALAAAGHRVIGVCAAFFEPPTLPPIQHDFVFELLGLVAFADPVRASAPDAVAQCYRAGVRTIMITGDHAATASTIAAAVGLRPRQAVVTGAEIDALDAAGLTARLATVNVFARVVPAQKLRLVRALEARGEVVAMTGDGVNDAPALRAAHVGIAMGARGTDVAREAADLVVMDDDFASITQAIRLGRRVYDNIRKATAYVLAIHVAIAALALVPVLLGWPLILLPVHIVFLELIVDPACSIAFEAEPAEADVMDRPPRDPGERLVEPRMVVLAVMQGMLAFLLVAGVLGMAIVVDGDEQRARTLAFSTLVVGNLALILANRSRSRSALAMLGVPNAALWWVVGGAFVLLTLVIGLGPVRAVFRFGIPSWVEAAAVVAAGVLGFAGFEALRRLARGRGASCPLGEVG